MSLQENGNYEGWKQQFSLKLNEQQERAVRTTEGPVLLLAVPGSGKTTVLVARLGYLIFCRGILPENILTITYTVAATRDMKRRFGEIFGEEMGERLEFRTINGISQKILQYFAGKMGKTLYPVADGETEGILRQVYREVTGSYATENDLRQMQLAISYVKNMRLKEKEIEELETEVEEFPKIYRAYNQALRERKRIDYDDQMVYAIKILEQYPQVLSYFKQKYKYLCVDEAQDTSKIQHDMIELLAGRNGNLFMVGDEDQSIYGFRAAYPEALIHFEQRHSQAKLLLMETNYRSRREIVEAADGLIQDNRSRHPKHMVPARQRGGCVRQIPAKSRRGQYQYLLEVAKDCGRQTAVLFRNNESALPLIDLLERAGIAYRMRGNDLTYFSHPVVTDICDFIRLAKDPWDGETFLRIYYKMGAGISRQLAEEAVQECNRRLTILDVIAESGRVSSYTRKQCRALATHLENMRFENAGRAIYRILHFMGYEEYMASRKMDGRKAEILQLLGEQEPHVLDFPGRLESLQQILKEGSQEKECPLILSTIHSSKGLEYDRVYMIDMLEGILPEESPKEEGYEEERRLFYVGMTRAKEELYIFTFGEKKSSAFSNRVFEARAMAGCHPGSRVRHVKYGTGEIRRITGNIAEIVFEKNGEVRKISLPVALKAGVLESLC